MKNSFYLNAIEYSIIIIENKIMTIINRTTFDKSLSLDKFINKLLKIYSTTLTKLLISLFQICVTFVYHSIIFKTVNIITLKKKKKIDYIISKTYRSMILLNIIDKIIKSIINKKNVVICEDLSITTRIAHEY